MKLPSQIKIKHKCVYEVVYITEFLDPNTLGECRYTDKQIAIKIGQKPAEEFKTFIHECIHALCYERKIEVSHKAIYKLEHAVEFILKANKWI